MPDQNLVAVVMPDGTIALEWEEAGETIGKSRISLQQEIHRRFVSNTEPWLLFLGFSNAGVPLSDSLDFWRGFALDFTGRIVKHPDLEALREQVDIPLDPGDIARYLDQAPLMTGSDYLGPVFLSGIWASMLADFKARIAAHQGTVAEWIRAYSPNLHLVGRIFFHLVENKNSDAPFAFLATYSTRLDAAGASKHVPLKFALQEYAGAPEKLLDLLTTVHRAAGGSAMIAEMLDSGEIFHPLAWSAGRALRFLKDIPVFENAGILCRIPDWWRGGASRPRLNIAFGGVKPSQLGMDAILDFKPTLFLEDTPITLAEAKRLLAAAEGLALIKNKWVAVDAKKLENTLAAYEQAAKMAGEEGVRLGDALRFQLQPEKLFDLGESGADIGVSNGQWLASVIGKLKAPGRMAKVTPGKKFQARLRPYQQQGLNWLDFLHSMGLGACLADDMGLGKTVQALAFLNRLKSGPGAGKKSRPASLLVIPASLLSNWTAELDAFAPDLHYLVLHPGFQNHKDLKKTYGRRLDAFDLVITTYALAARHAWLQSHQWFYLILDEAQAIKNPGAKQAKALKKYSAANRLVMTGTPIENRLSDLWSLFDFINPGLLGTAAEFKRFSKNLGKDRGGYTRLRRLVRPYILRRLKTDKTVITDLPDKVEMKTFAALSKAQTVHYRQLVDEIQNVISEKKGMARKGLILSALMKFKQLCNHPDQYLGTGGYAENESGKFVRLREICETIYEKREKVLVFTQFKEITGPLSRFLESIFNQPGVIIHGSVPAGKRKEIIDSFQQDARVPFMVLSLKAGGVGLNLTQANHVIHFDRWWNPAVEDQATDRAFRIGQKKKVIVHKFITRGTVEEKINRMLEGKKRLTEDVISNAGEKWVTEMDNDELVDLFSLSL
ncbi:MAG: DEAD/DEAH box helicase [Desulfobacterales bacterium]|nr:DEAD/DEAH box helicase [Desulfobacterales bacterium]